MARDNDGDASPEIPLPPPNRRRPAGVAGVAGVAATSSASIAEHKSKLRKDNAALVVHLAGHRPQPP